MPASTSGTSAGVACSYTSMAGFSSLIALKYAWERTVAGVAMTPTRRLREASAAECAPGRTTPRIGTSYRRRISGSATADAVLQATTMAFTSRAARSSRHSNAKRMTSSSGRGP